MQTQFEVTFSCRFTKICFPLQREAHFWKPSLSNRLHFWSILSPQGPQNLPSRLHEHIIIIIIIIFFILIIIFHIIIISSSSSHFRYHHPPHPHPHLTPTHLDWLIWKLAPQLHHDAFFPAVCKNMLLAAAGSTFLKTMCKQSAFEYPLFGALMAYGGVKLQEHWKAYDGIKNPSQDHWKAY